MAKNERATNVSIACPGPRATFGLLLVLATSLLLVACSTPGAPAPAAEPIAPASPTPEASPPGSVIESATANFRYRIPSPHWVPIAAHPAVPNAQFVMQHDDPMLWFAIVVDPEPDDGTTPESFIRTFDEQLAAQGAVVRSAPAEPLTLDGVAGLVAEWVATQGAESARYRVWAGVHGGWFYRLYGWSDATVSESQTMELMRSAITGFSLRDRAADSTAGGGERVTVHRSGAFGYEVDLGGADWQEWGTVQEALPGADWAAIDSDRAALVVMPFVLDEGELPQSVVEDALIELLGRPRPAELRPLQIGDLTGVEFGYEGASGGRALQYRVHVLVGPGRAFLNLVWADANDAAATHSLAVLDRIQYEVVAADALPAIESLSAARQRAHGMLLNGLGARLTEQSAPGRAIRLLERAEELAPDDPQVLTNLVRASILAGRHAEALAALAATTIDVERVPQLIAHRAVARSRVGDPEAALADFSAAFAAGMEEESFFELWMQLLLDANRADEALQQLDPRIERTRSTRLRLVRARVLRSVGDLARAADELRALVEAMPGSRELRREWIDVLHEQKAHEAALESSREALESFGATAEFHVLAARSLQALGRIREAREELEHALALDPDDLIVRQSLEYLSMSIGEGANSLVRTPIEPVPIPPEVSTGKGVAPSSAEIETFGAWYRRWVQGVFFQAGRELRRTTALEVVVASRSGIEPFSSFEVEFRPFAEELYVNLLQVRDESGSVVSRGDPAQFYVLDGNALGGATSVKKLHVPVPGVRPGVTIEFVYTKRDRVPPAELPLIDHVFTASIPVAWAALYVAGDVEDLQWSASPGLRREQGPSAVWWSLAPVPAHPLEPLQQRAEGFLPRVSVGSGGRRWDVLARDYLADLKDLLPAPAEVANLAAQSADAAATVDERARQVAAAVQQRLSYKAIEFGRRARIPPPSDESLHSASGDCKDHALLVVQMMRSAGIDADLALVNLGQEIDPSLPSLDQFDHMIAYCADCQQQRYFDATGKDLPVGLDVPLGLAGKTALILDAENPRLERIPSHAPAYHWAVEERSIRLDPSGDLEIQETLEVQGVYAAALRRSLRGRSPGAARDAIQNLLADDSPRTIRNVEVRNLDAPEEPLRIELDSRVPRRFSATSRELVGRLPASWARTLIGVPTAEGRESPFTLPVPVRFSSRTRVSAPAHFGVSADPATGASGEEGMFVAWTGSRTSTSEELVMELELERASGDFAPELYGRLTEEIDASLAFLEQTLIFEREPVLGASASDPSTPASASIDR